MSRVLVTGMSGTGKSSALAELGRRGYLGLREPAIIRIARMRR